MAPHRNVQQQENNNNTTTPLPTISDNESDIQQQITETDPSASASGTTRTDSELNLAVLKRHDTSIIALEHVSPYAVVYIFSTATQEWEKSGIEGTSFICRLAPNSDCADRFVVMVLNRRGMDNFRFELMDEEQVDVSDEYIMMQSGSGDEDEEGGQQKVYGLWVYCEPPPSSTSQDRVRAAKKIQECAVMAGNSRRLARERLENGYEAETDEITVPEHYREPAAMGRQLSVRQLFNQESQGQVVEQSQQDPPRSGAPLFAMSADTEFFHSAPRLGPSPLVSPSPATQNQNMLLDLFRKGGPARGQ
ncbi:mRNA-decapping enzyme 1B [Agyrium rufum]|nr:mRNA-decapping enzyme 1B [Agyrium rufum]